MARRRDAYAGHLKGRVAEALVEAIFMRAGYAVSRIGRESQVQRLVKIGEDEFLPDFMLRKEVAGEGDRPLHRLIPVEVKYRRDVEGYLRRYGQALFTQVAPHWPDLCFVFVTDNPAPDRSCFQVVDLARGEGAGCVDLNAVPELDVYATTVREYESLVRQIFPLLEAQNVDARRKA